MAFESFDEPQNANIIDNETLRQLIKDASSEKCPSNATDSPELTEDERKKERKKQIDDALKVAADRLFVTSQASTCLPPVVIL